MQPKKDYPGFNIRKVYKKHNSISKNPQQLLHFSPQLQVQKNTEFLTYTNHKRQKDLILDQTVNQAILNSKPYGDLKSFYQQNKKKNKQRRDQLQQEIQNLKKQKQQLKAESLKVIQEKQKFLQTIEMMKEKIQRLRNQNKQRRDNAQYMINTEAQYFNNLILSMRFQAQFQHNIDPDQMTYEQLLQLQEKIGNVSKGLPQEKINQLPKVQITQQIQDNCTVCQCSFEISQIMTKLQKCNHIFHFDCLKVWLQKEKVCPVCKQQLLG